MFGGYKFFLNRLGHRKRFSLCPKIKDYRYTEPCRMSVGVVVAHVPDKCLILFIFIPGEDNGVVPPAAAPVGHYRWVNRTGIRNHGG